ncbi:MAG TPA: fumarylacetoacetate hydrolase family protein [Gaiellaceae bacterium]|nr:fumarylacetoacetate hydrolase family protein [Gaiellaceae bacterium]
MEIQRTWRSLFERDLPGKIICVGLNYQVHAEESSIALPAAPLLFGKFANTLVGDGESIVLPKDAGHVDAEAELAIVIGRRARRVPREEALTAVFGYTVANDVSAREIQFADQQWFRGKGFDTFCPLLPSVVPVADLGAADNLRVTQRLNGTRLQSGNTSDLIFDVPTLVSYISKAMTLDAGDVILTGTPEGVGYFREPKVGLKPGDEVEVEVEGIGVLRNTVVADAD